jgi:uncharacterized protein YdhG (YjbR/CyaY superfamily)
MQLHATILKAAPGAKEGLKWSMPAYSYDRILVTWSAFQHHTGFYPTPSAVEAFAESLVKFKTAKGSIQFPHDKPIPLPLITKLVKFRVKESRGVDVKWKPKRGQVTGK